MLKGGEGVKEEVGGIWRGWGTIYFVDIMNIYQRKDGGNILYWTDSLYLYIYLFHIFGKGLGVGLYIAFAVIFKRTKFLPQTPFF